LRSAIIASDQFKKKYILETEKYYLPMGKGTIFEEELNDALVRLAKG